MSVRREFLNEVELFGINDHGLQVRWTSSMNHALRVVGGLAESGLELRVEDSVYISGDGSAGVGLSVEGSHVTLTICSHGYSEGYECFLQDETEYSHERQTVLAFRAAIADGESDAWFTEVENHDHRVEASMMGEEL